MQAIAPGLFTFQRLFVGRVYMIEDTDGITLVDAGLAFAPSIILQSLVKAGRTVGDVRRILVTHAHPDHVGGLTELQGRTGAEVIASRLEQPVIEGHTAVPRPDRESLHGAARYLSAPDVTFKPTTVNRIVEDGDILQDVMGGLHVVSTPGHAPGHLAFWQPERRILFCGDVVMRLPRLRLPFAVGTVDMAENRRSLQRIAALEPETLCLGHGQPFRSGAAQPLRAFASKVA